MRVVPLSCLLLAFVLMAARAVAQPAFDNNWTQRTPTPTSVGLAAVVAHGGGFIGVGQHGAAITSATGSVWVSQSTGSTAWLRGMTSTGVLAAAVGSGGTVLTTTDGVAWTRRTTPTHAELRDVAWDGTQLIAVGENGVILSSTETGASWEAQDSGTTLRLRGVAVLGTLFVAVGEQGKILISSDGIAWSSAVSGSSSALNGIASSPSTLCIVGDGGTALTSNDGSAWTLRSTGTTGNFSRVTWTGSEFLAVGDDGIIYASATGSSWAARTSGTTQGLSGIATSSNINVVVGDLGTILSSANATTWQARNTGPTEWLHSVVAGGPGLIAVGNGGSIYTSVDGSGWTVVVSGTTQPLLAVAAGNGMAVAVGSAGTLLTSPDGSTWTARASGSTEALTSVVFNGSIWLAVGTNGHLVASTNASGTTWNRSTSGSVNFADVAWTGSDFIVVGANGRIITSSTGSGWTTRTSGTSESLSSVVWSGSQAVAVGAAGTVLTSPTGAIWTNQSLSTATFGHIGFSHIGMIGTDLYACGYGGEPHNPRGLIMGSPDGMTWTTRNVVAVPPLTSFAVGGAQAIAVGANGAVLASGPVVVPDADFELTSSSAVEADATILVTVRLSSAPSSNVSIPFTVTGTATESNTADFSVVPASHILSIPAGQLVGSIQLSLHEDTLDESDETIVLQLTGPVSGAVLGSVLQHTFTLTDDDTAPMVVAHDLSNRLVPLGSATTYTVTATGDALSYRWMKNNVTIKGQTGSSYSIPSTQLSHAGSYGVEVKNPAGTVILGPVDLAVVSTAAATQTLAYNQTATLSLSAASVGGTTLYQWRKNGVLVDQTNDARISGATTKTLVIRVLTLGDAGVYTCEVMRNGLSLIGGGITLNVIFPPVVQTAALAGAMVSESYNQPITASNAPTRYLATGLPSGLSLNTLSGVITGRSLVAGTFYIKLSASNFSGYGPVTILPLVITALPTGTVGAYTASVAREAVLNGSLGGRLVLTTTSSGSYSGSVTLGAKSYPFSGVLDTAVGTDPHVTAKSVTRPGSTPLSLTFILAPSTRSITGTLSDATPASVGFAGASAMPVPLTASTGYHTFALPLRDMGDVGIASIPQGFSSGSCTVATTGKTSGSIRLADGNTFTFSTALLGAGEIVLYQPLYSNQGSLLGTLHLGAAPDGLISTTGLTWLKKAQSGAATALVVRTYGSGFGGVAGVNLSAFGGRYLAPVVANGDIVMGLAASLDNVPNAKLVFADGDVPDPATRLPYSIRLSSPATRDPQTPVANPGFIALSITASTGLFSGSFKLTDSDTTLAEPKPLTRTSAFSGYIVRDAANLRQGYGSFTLPKMPQNSVMPFTTSSTSPILSGNVVLKAE